MPGKHATAEQIELYQAYRLTLGRADSAEKVGLGMNVARRIDQQKHFQQLMLAGAPRRCRGPGLSRLWEHRAALYLGEHPDARAVQVFEYLLSDAGSVVTGLSRSHRRSFERWFVIAKADWAAKAEPKVQESQSHAFLRAAHLGRFNADLSPTLIRADLELSEILNNVSGGALSQRNRALFALGFQFGLPLGHLASYLMLSDATAARWRDRLITGEISAFLSPDIRRRPQRTSQELKDKLFKILHAPPTTYGYSRTNWRAVDLKAAMLSEGCLASLWTIRNIVKGEGYRWRRARISLTSNDPKYREKLDRVKSILFHLGEDECFYSVDEYGPFTIRIVRGRKLVAGSSTPVVPQWQRSKGKIIMTAALELRSNQVTHFYSDKKNTTEMIKLIELVRKQCQGRRNVYISWDSASWHMSNALDKRIIFLNDWAAFDNMPVVILVPLPARAQFLNVIEAVFSGMSRAVIHNSDFKDDVEAKSVIDGYIQQRNAHFSEHPRSAGKKIWGREPAPAEFNISGNFKDSRFR